MRIHEPELTVQIEHHFSAAHRLPKQPGHCRYLHGHNYKVTITLAQAYPMEELYDGMVVDFQEIERGICRWIDHQWGHALLYWDQDTEIVDLIARSSFTGSMVERRYSFSEQPTAEVLACYLAENALAATLADIPCEIAAVTVEEEPGRSATISYLARDAQTTPG